MKNRIVFIDSHIANYQTLIAQLPHTTKAILLDAERHGIEQILMALRGKTELSAIDLITHGSPGTITLGSGVLNNDNLGDYAEQLRQIGQHLVDDGDILLYGCEVAKGQNGQTFIKRFAQLTQAHVAASTTLTGSSELNADWRLQAHLGAIQAEALQFAYDGVLAIIDGTVFHDTLTGTPDDDVFTGGAGNDLLIGGGGNDVARFLGNHDEYQLSTDETGKITVRDVNATNDDEGTDTLDGDMTLRFTDGDYAADVVSRGGEFRVNTTTADLQQNPAITALAGGGFVVSWESRHENPSSPDIYVQRYNAEGIAQGGEFRVNTLTVDHQQRPAITALANGGFMVCWESIDANFSNIDIYAQRYNADGTAQGEEFQVNTTSTDYQFKPTITALADGGSVVSWMSYSQDGSGYGIYAQRYNANGSAQGGEFQINTTAADHQRMPSITALTDGGFVASWESFAQDGSGWGVYAQRYNADGTAQGEEFRINTTTADHQMNPTTTALANGGFVVCWEPVDPVTSIADSIYAQQYNADGTPEGGEFLVATNLAHSIPSNGASTITGINDGGFVVSWVSKIQDGISYEIHAKRYNSDGTAQGGGFRVNTETNELADAPAITALADGGFVISWRGDINNIDGISAQRYDAAGNPVQSVVQLSPIDTGTNQTPVLNSALVDQAVKFDNALNYNAGAAFSDPDGDALSFSATLANGDSLPAWLQIDETSGMISGTPAASDRGIYSLSVTAADPHGADIAAPVIVAVTSIDAGYLLVSTAGNDTLAGTAANDSVTYAVATSPVTVSLAIATQQNTVGAGLDTLTAINNLIGSDFNDSLTGNAQNNALESGAGNDVLNGAGGADIMIGGLGDDTFVVNNTGDIVTELLNEGIDKVNSNLAYTLPAHVEHLTLTGTAAINGSGNDLNNILTGNGADNELNGQAGNDTLNGGGGNDTLIGWSGADIMIGGAGNDTYFVENSGDVVTELFNAGTDTVSSRLTYTLPNNVDNLTLTGNTAINGTGNALANVITGNTAANLLSGLGGNDTLNGGGGNDTLNGGAGIDSLNGGAGADSMLGGTGDDNYVVENTGDIVAELLNEGKDTVSTQLTYILPTNVEHLTLTGSSAANGTGNILANTIIGNTAANQLNGLAGNDTLIGDAGNDSLDGGTGTDLLTGGTGNDVFKFTTAGGIDSITDFSVVNDTIQLENAVFTALNTGTLAPAQFRVGTQALDGNDFVIYNNVTGALLYDANGNGAGAAVQIATLSAGLGLTNADFVVI